MCMLSDCVKMSAVLFRGLNRTSDPLELDYRRWWAAWSEYSELKLGPLEKQQVLFFTKPSLQLPLVFLIREAMNPQ